MTETICEEPCPPAKAGVGTLPPGSGPAPTTATGVDCSGAAVTATAFGVVQSVPHPTAVQLVRLCPANEYDREVAVLCDPATGAPITVVQYWLENAAPGTPPVVEAYTAAGTAYGGSVAALVRCPGERFDITAPQIFCAAGVTVTRTDVYLVDGTAPVFSSSIWQDATGAVIPPPAPGDLLVGSCADHCSPQTPVGVITAWG